MINRRTLLQKLGTLPVVAPLFVLLGVRAGESAPLVVERDSRSVQEWERILKHECEDGFTLVTVLDHRISPVPTLGYVSVNQSYPKVYDHIRIETSGETVSDAAAEFWYAWIKFRDKTNGFHLVWRSTPKIQKQNGLWVACCRASVEHGERDVVHSGCYSYQMRS